VQKIRRIAQQREGRSIPIKDRPIELSLEQSEALSHNSTSPSDSSIQGVYIISVAARLLAMHPQTLRKYERLGLVRPSRTVGMLRLYSDEDLEKLRLIRYLETQLGMNLAGVEFTLNLLDNLLELHQRLSLHNRMKTLNTVVAGEIKYLFKQLNLPFQVYR